MSELDFHRYQELVVVWGAWKGGGVEMVLRDQKNEAPNMVHCRLYVVDLILRDDPDGEAGGTMTIVEQVSAEEL